MSSRLNGGPRSARCDRRRFVRAGLAGGGLLLLGACGGDDSGQAEPTATPEPTPTVELTPTATQGPIGTPVAGYTDPERWAGRTLTVATWGGGYQVAEEQAFFDPFEAATGATILLKRADLGRLRNQVDNEEVTWDILTVPAEEVLRLAREGYLTAIDYQVVDKTALFDDASLQHGVGVAYFSTVIVYPAGSTSAPSDWGSFWDVPPLGPGEEPTPENARALRRSPVGTLEFALLADGVPMTELYPLDVERAFASLDRIRPSVIFWYEDGKQPVELVVTGQVGMASAWSVRPWQLDVADQTRLQWYGGMLSLDAWVVPKGAPNPDVAMDFINYATRAVPSANFARLVPYGPVNKDAFGYLRSDRVAMLPSAPSNRAVQFVENWAWWADNREPLTERFEDWLLSEPPEVEPATPTAEA